MDNAILLLRSYISEDLYQSFCTHFNTQKAVIKVILKFMEHSCRLIKLNIWKVRSAAWKAKKRALDITKNSFKNYHQIRNMRNLRLSHRESQGYICPQMVTLRNYYNHADLLFIILASSNFLHSGLLFKLT
ncbi:unnamed protein product [Rhizophagus irregularis]|nr:unnamed protein product [Rhizophagus irregularis]